MGDWLSPDPWFGDEDDEISAALTNLKLHKPKTYTTQSLATYRAACIALRRRGVPGAVCRSHLSQLVLYRRAARAPHPTPQPAPAAPPSDNPKHPPTHQGVNPGVHPAAAAAHTTPRTGVRRAARLCVCGVQRQIKNGAAGNQADGPPRGSSGWLHNRRVGCGCTSDTASPSLWRCCPPSLSAIHQPTAPALPAPPAGAVQERTRRALFQLGFSFPLPFL